MNSVKVPISSGAGVVVIVLYCVFTFSSLVLYPTAYSPATNWLSDLGNSTYNPNGAIIYNWGCILTGIALFPFFIGLYKWYENEKRYRTPLLVAQAVGCVAAFSLIMIGVFSEDSGWPHRLWSQIFFMLNLTILIQVGSFLFTHPRHIRAIAYYGYAAAAINVMLILVPNMPLLEWFTVFTALGNVGLLSYNMSKKL
jgi:hypothetical membrane protein